MHQQHAEPAEAPAVKAARFRRVKFAGFLLRCLAFVLSIAALIAITTGKLHSYLSLPIPGFRANGPLDVSLENSYSKVFRYIVIASVVSAVYAVPQAARSLNAAVQEGYQRALENRSVAWLSLLADQIMTYLLLAAAVASIDAVNAGEKSSKTAASLASCLVFSKFCEHLIASIVFILLAALLLSNSAILSAYELFGLSRK